MLMFFMFIAKISQSQISAHYKLQLFNSSQLGYAVAMRTNDAGFVLAGYTQDNSSSKYYRVLSKYDHNGLHSWTKKYSDFDQYFTINSVSQTSDGGYLISGQPSLGPNTGYPTILRTDTYGIGQWGKRFIPNATFYSEGKRSLELFNTIYSSGTYGVVQWPYYISYLIKMDAWGNEIWKKSYSVPGLGQFENKDLIVTKDNKLLMTGKLQDTLNNQHIYITKTDTSGTVNWSKKITFSERYIRSGDMIELRDGSLLFITAKGNNTGFFLTKADPSGDVFWSKLFHGSIFIEDPRMTSISDNEFLITVSVYDTSSQGSFVMKIDSTGEVQNSYQIGGKLWRYRGSQIAAFAADKIIAYTREYQTPYIHYPYLALLDNIQDTAGYCNVRPYSLFENVEIVISSQINVADVSAQDLFVTPGTFSTVTDSVLATPICNTTQISFPDQEYGNLRIYPSPCNSNCFIETGLFSNATLLFYDITGRLCKMLEIKDYLEIDVSGMMKGMYFLRVINEEGKLNTAKLIVN